jgi:hypothetical protein
MNLSAEPFGLPDDAPELARRFAMIMAGLGALIARRFVKMPHLSGFTMLLWSRLNRAVRRFHRALTCPGRVRAPLVRAERGEVTRARPVALPSGRGWIVRELGWEAAAFLLYLETLLGEIETQAALAGAPRTGRILRPICRMLGVRAEVTPKIVPSVVTQKIAPRTVRMAAQALGRSQTPHPDPLPGGEGEGPLPVAGRIFSGT